MATHRDLLPGQWITILREMTAPAMRPIWAGTPKLTPWLPDLEARHVDIKGASELKAPEPEAQEVIAEPVPSRTLDRRVEAAVRVIFHLHKVLYNFWVALAQEDKALKVLQAQHFVFDNGLSFLTASYGAQVGETDRMVNLARNATVREVVGAFTVLGRDYDGLLGLVDQTNDALADRIKQEAAPPPPDSPPTPDQLARRLATFFNHLVPLIEMALPDDEGEAKTADRVSLLASLRRELEIADRRLHAAAIQTPALTPLIPDPPRP